jgi:peptide/nickel transport system permease protein
MKGLPTNQVIRHHVLRNGLQPTVSVVGVQVGYVLGSLVVIEKIFNYPGLGGTIASAAAKDPPVLVAGVLVVAIVYMLATLSADLILAWMNPRASIAASSEIVRTEPA